MNDLFTRGWTSGEGSTIFTQGWVTFDVTVIVPPTPGNQGGISQRTYKIDPREVDKFFEEIERRDTEMILLSIAVIDALDNLLD